MKEADRNRTILDLAVSGETYKAIAARYGVSKQRIEQIVKRNGITVPTSRIGRREKRLSLKEQKTSVRAAKHAADKAIADAMTPHIVAGMSINEAGRLLGLARVDIMRCCRKFRLGELNVATPRLGRRRVIPEKQ